MAHELSITVERDGKHFLESSVEPGKVLAGPFDTEEEATAQGKKRSREFDQFKSGFDQFIEQGEVPFIGAAEPEAPVVEQVDTSGFDRFIPQERPGVMQRVIGEPLTKIGEAIAEGAQEGFDIFDQEDEPILRPLPVGEGGWLPWRALKTQGALITRAAEAGARGAIGLLFGVAEGAKQTLREFGMTDAEVRRTVRDGVALLDSTIILSFMTTPAKALGVAATEIRAAKRAARGATKFQTAREALRETSVSGANLSREEEIALIANNAARARRARKKGAAEGDPGDRAYTEATKMALRRMDDADSEALAMPFLDDPAKIGQIEVMMERPVFRDSVLSTEAQRKAMVVARQILKDRGTDPAGLAPHRVQTLIADMLNTSEAFTGGLKAEAEAAGFRDFGEFIMAFLYTGSKAGRDLNIRSQFFGNLRRQALKGDKVAAEGLDEAFGPLAARAMDNRMLTPTEGSELFLRRASRIFRKLIISLPVTAVRNLIEAGGIRMLLQGTNRLIDSTFQRVFFPNSKGMANPAESFDMIAKIWSRSGRKETKATIDRLTAAFPAIKSRAFASLEADISLIARSGRAPGKLDRVENFIDKYLLAMNRAQEFVVRRAVLSTRLDEQLRRVGSSVTEMIDEGIIPAGFNRALTTSIDDALELTYALPPTSRAGLNKFFKGYSDLIEGSKVFPFLEPFPRFLFNQTKYVLDQMPTGFLRLTSTQNKAKIANGDFSVLAKELTGAALLGTAFAIRSGDFPGLTPGERFDEIITSEGNILPLAPFASIAPWLFIADLYQRLDEGRFQVSTDAFKEFRKGLLGAVPQVAQGSSALQDAFQFLTQINTLAGFEKLKDFLGGTLSGFGRPLALIRDFREEWMETARLQRETRGQGFTAALENIVAPELLPERESPTRAATPSSARLSFGPIELGAGVVSQVTGIRAREPRNAIEKELAFHGFTAKHLSPKTGSKRVDALIARFQGPLMEIVGEALFTKQAYKNLSIKTRQKFLSDIIVLTRDRARPFAQALAPSAFVAQRVKGLPSAKRELIIEQLDILLRSQGKADGVKELLNKAEAQIDRELREAGL